MKPNAIRVRVVVLDLRLVLLPALVVELVLQPRTYLSKIPACVKLLDTSFLCTPDNVHHLYTATNTIPSTLAASQARPFSPAAAAGASNCNTIPWGSAMAPSDRVADRTALGHVAPSTPPAAHPSARGVHAQASEEPADKTSYRSRRHENLTRVWLNPEASANPKQSQNTSNSFRVFIKGAVLQSMKQNPQ